MELTTLYQELHALISVPCIKIRQPWASWILYKKKNYEIRTLPNHQKGLVGLIATGWDFFFEKPEITTLISMPYVEYALIGFAHLVGLKHYQTQEEFDADHAFHLNPPEFFRGERYAWILDQQTPIQPLYYTHTNNIRKGNTIPLMGQMARVRILTASIIDRIQLLPAP